MDKLHMPLSRLGMCVYEYICSFKLQTRGGARKHFKGWLSSSTCALKSLEKWKLPSFIAASAAVTTGLERHAALALYQSPGVNDFGARQKVL